MPLMLLNLRAMPSGLESHKKFVETEVGKWLGHTDQADVTFICTNSSPSNPTRNTVCLTAHQAVFAPLSPVLKEIFNQHSCGHRREMVNITIDTDPQVLKAVLSLVYRGTTTLSTQSVDELKSIVKMLNLTFPGGFERVELAANDIPPPQPNQTKPASVKRPRLPSQPPGAGGCGRVESVANDIPSPPNSLSKPASLKRPSAQYLHHAEPKRSRPTSPTPTASKPLFHKNGVTTASIKPPNLSTASIKPPNLSTASSSSPVTKASATDRMNMHVSMTLQLKDAPSGTTALCKMPNCGEQVTYEQLSEHFLAHETCDGARDSSGPVSFPCVACGISFKYRRQLDIHTKNKHGGGMTETERLKLLSDSDSSDNEDTSDPLHHPLEERSTAPQSSMMDYAFKSGTSKTVPPMLLKRPGSSQSDWSIDKEPGNYCNICDHTFKTTKAKNVHMSSKHSNSKDNVSSENKAKSLMESKLNLSTASTGNDAVGTSSTASGWKKYGCQICTKRFNEFCQLRTHYTLYHFWDNLSEDYQHMGDKCNICMLKFPTEDHLIQHMGNFHCIIDKYLVKKGLRIISEEKTVKLRSWKCEFCQVLTNSNAALKSHLAVKHYQKQLAAEFPVERGRNKKCPKCYKLFEGSSLNSVIAHVGSFHDEVIKYAIDVIDLYEGDKEKIPVDDFDDGTIGTPFEKEVAHVYKCATCDYTCETRSALKDHYLDQHYAGKFMEKFPVPFCQFCDQEYLSLSVLHRHIVKKHEREFSSILYQDGISLPSLVSPRRRKKVEYKGTFDYLFCQICLQELPTSMMLKAHYIRHYQLHFQSHYFTVTCPFCEKKFGEVLATQRHIATDHAEQSLIPLMERENLWVNKSVVLEQNSVKMKRIEIPIKKVPQTVVEKHFEELEESRVYSMHDCVFPSCDKVFEKRKEFLIHLAISHFWKDLTLEFGEKFSEDPVSCPVCKEKVNPNHDKTTYYKHLAVAHETVMKYVQTIGRQEPQISAVQTPDRTHPISSSTSPPSSSRVPVIRFSNDIVGTEVGNQSGKNGSDDRDSEIDRILKKHGAESLVNGTTVESVMDTSSPPPAEDVEVKEEITTEETLLPSAPNDIMSKMRDVFESDSDSD